MAAIQVDFVTATDERPAEVLAAMAEGLSLVTRVVTESGPAGGNPLGEVTGTEDALEAFLCRHNYDLEAYDIR